MRNILTLIAALILLGACKERDDGAYAVKLVNGATTAVYPAVVELFIERGDDVDSCTGVFLDGTTLATALHCIADGTTGQLYDAVLPTATDTPPSARFYDAAYLQGLHSQTFAPAHDLAILKYPAAVAVGAGAAQFPPLATASPAVGDPVTLVGFGASVIGGVASGEKTTGSNTVAVADGATISLNGVAHGDATHPTGQGTSVAGGDSGGPLLAADGSLVGICSFETWNLAQNAVTSIYIDMSGTVAQGILSAAAGAAAAAAPAAGGPN